jgi:hypothetical protein
METLVVAFLVLITLHRPDGHQVSINPRHVTSITPATDHGMFAPGIHCLVHTDDRKFISVRETCDQVREQMKRKHLG